VLQPARPPVNAGFTRLFGDDSGTRAQKLTSSTKTAPGSQPGWRYRKSASTRSAPGGTGAETLN
jgi:hypothetical protein